MFLEIKSTPNPKSIKFELIGKTFDIDRPIIFSRSQIGIDKFIDMLFVNEEVESVFINKIFVTLTFNDATQIQNKELLSNIQCSINNYIRNFESLKIETTKKQITQEEMQQYTNEVLETDSEIVKQIKGYLKQYIEPAVSADGGEVLFVSYENTIVKLILLGACRGCPSSSATLKGEF